MTSPSMTHYDSRLTRAGILMVPSMVVIVFMLCINTLYPTSSIPILEPKCTRDNGPLRIACIGDSITYGNGTASSTMIEGVDRGNYPLKLQQVLEDDYLSTQQGSQSYPNGIEVRNFGVRGATLMAPRFDDQWPSPQLSFWTTQAYVDAVAWQPQVVIIMLGTNDSKLPKWGSAEKAAFTEDYLRLLDVFANKQQNPCVPKTWMAIPPKLESDKWFLSESSLRQEIIPLIQAVAEEENISLLYVRNALEDDRTSYAASHWYCLQDDPPGDGVHPCLAGTEHFAQYIATYVIEWLQSH